MNAGSQPMSAVISEAASLAVAFAGLAFSLPIARFAGPVWLLGIAFTLPATRRQILRRR